MKKVVEEIYEINDDGNCNKCDCWGLDDSDDSDNYKIICFAFNRSYLKSASFRGGMLQCYECKEYLKKHKPDQQKTNKATKFYLNSFLSKTDQTEIILKGQRMGYSVSIEELGAGTIITFLED